MIGESQQRSPSPACGPDVPRGQHVTIARRVFFGVQPSALRRVDATDWSTTTPGTGQPRPVAWRVTWQQLCGELEQAGAVTPDEANEVVSSLAGGEGWLELAWYDGTRGGRCIVDAAGGSVTLPPTTAGQAKLLVPDDLALAAVVSANQTLAANAEARVQVAQFQVSATYAAEYDPGSHRAPTFTESGRVLLEPEAVSASRVFYRPDFASRVMVSGSTLVGLASVRWLRFVSPALNGGLITVERDEPVPGDAVALLVTTTATIDVQVTWTLEL
jgi:hypothetical protein